MKEKKRKSRTIVYANIGEAFKAMFEFMQRGIQCKGVNNTLIVYDVEE